MDAYILAEELLSDPVKNSDIIVKDEIYIDI